MGSTIKQASDAKAADQSMSSNSNAMMLGEVKRMKKNKKCVEFNSFGKFVSIMVVIAKDT